MIFGACFVALKIHQPSNDSMQMQKSQSRMKRFFDMPSAAKSFGLFFWLLAAFSLTQWALLLWPFEKKSLANPAEFPLARAMAKNSGDLEEIQKMLGGQARLEASIGETSQAPSPLESRLQLKGIVRSGSRGIALVAVDGQPSKPFAIGKEVLPGVLVRKIQTDKIHLESAKTDNDPFTVTLALPKKQ
jgi:general secretion pathway protein C